MQIRQETCISSGQNRQTIFLIPLECLGLVDSALVENRVDGGEEELGDDFDAALERNYGLRIGSAHDLMVFRMC